MLLRAAADLDLDLQRSWFIGDILDDIEAGNRAGCRTILVDLGTEQIPEQPLRCPDFVAHNTLHSPLLVHQQDWQYVVRLIKRWRRSND
jgi:D-glycero-D-manno-heptose 1,7-bisphosphate phosphatase